jgi:hypothetical protein
MDFPALKSCLSLLYVGMYPCVRARTYRYRYGETVPAAMSTTDFDFASFHNASFHNGAKQKSQQVSRITILANALAQSHRLLYNKIR